MLNRPTSDWVENDAIGGPWDVDRSPGLRLGSLWIGIIVSLVFVAARMGQLQFQLRNGLITGFEQSEIVKEPIPARVGRILTSDGTVLATDEEHYDLQVYYPLIRQPVEEAWVRAEALRNLNPQDWKNKASVKAEMERVRQSMEVLWSTLAGLCNESPEQLAASRQNVQRRIEKLVAAVHRHREAHRKQESDAYAALSMTSAAGWQGVWNRVHRELTEPPPRNTDNESLEEEQSFHTIATNVDADVKAEIDANPKRYPGVRIQVRMLRHYPQRELAAHLIGHRTLITESEYDEQRRLDAPVIPADYRPGDSIGRNGLELKYESHLHGTPGFKRLAKRRGRVVKEIEVKQPVHGRDLYVSMDSQLQQNAEQFLDEALEKVTPAAVNDDESNHGGLAQPTCPQGGCLIALDVHTGAILAAASAPRFDANLYIRRNHSDWKEVMDDRRKPFFHRATHMKLPPGSAFKIVSAVAGLESRKIDPWTPIHCQGYLDRPDQYRCLIYRHSHSSHGDIRLADALCKSCNVYFFTAARRMGPAALADWAERFGFGSSTGIDLPSEDKGHVPSPDEVIKGQKRRWTPSDTLGVAIGQADLLVTPLQMARAVAAIANDGLLVTPHLAIDVGPVSINEDQTHQPTFSHPEPEPIADLHDTTLGPIREGLDKVVNNPSGTAYKYARSTLVRMAGKTGTAQSANGADHAWFAGYFPSDRPRVAIVVVLEHGGSGGKAAAPIAKKFAEAMFKSAPIPPSADLVSE